MKVPTNIAIVMNIQQVCERILSTGELTREEHMQLMSSCLNDGLVNKDERHAINRVLDEIQFGKLTFVEAEVAA